MIPGEERALGGQRAGEGITSSELIHLLPDAILVYDPGSRRLVQANQATADLLGHALADLASMQLEDVVMSSGPFGLEQARPILERAAAGEPVPPFEWMLRGGCGETLWVEIHLRAHRTSDGVLFVFCLRDVRERQRRRLELVNLNALNAVLAELGQITLSVESHDELFERVCECLVRVGGFSSAWVALEETDGGASPVAWSGDAREVMTGISCAGETIGLRVKVHQHGGECACPSLATVALPSCSGTLSVGAAQPDFFVGAHVEMLEKVGTDLDLALELLHTRTERRRTERALETERAKLQHITQVLPVGLLTYDAEGRITYVNRRLEEILELSGDDLRGLAHDAPLWFSGRLESPWLSGELPFSVVRRTQAPVLGAEASWQRVDGEKLFLTLNFVPLIGEGGFEGVVVTVEDVTAHTVAEMAVRASHEQFRTVFEQAGCGMVLAERQGVFIRANAAFCDFIGYSEAEISHLHVREITHPDDWEIDLHLIRELDEGRVDSVQREKRYVCKDGTVKWGHLTVTPLGQESDGRAYLGMVVDVTKRREAEEALLAYHQHLEELVRERTTDARRGELRLRTIVNVAVDGIITLDERASIQSMNPSACAMFRYSEAEMLGRTIYSIIPRLRLPTPGPGPTLAPSRRLEETFGHDAAESSFPLEYAVVASDIDGNLMYTVIVHDITMRKRAEHAMLESEERYRLLFATSPDAIIMSQIGTWNIRWANPAASRLVGCSVVQLQTMTLLDLHPADVLQRLEEALQSGGDVAEIRDVPCRRLDGSVVYADINPAPLVVRGLRCALGVYRDVTVRHRIDAELRKLTRAIEHSPVSVVVTDRQGIVEYVNPKFTQVTGFTAEESVGKTPGLIKSGYHGPDFYREMWATILSGSEWHGDLCNRRKSGELFWESSSIAPVRNAQGDITHFVAIKLDVTERRRVDEELRQAKDAAETANRAKSAFLANMSHEIRTPLNAILGFSQLMIGQKSLNPEQIKSVEAINRSGEHLLALINDVLELSKIEAGRASLNSSTFDLHRLLEDLEMMFRVRTTSKGLELVVERHVDLPRYIKADQGKLRQVFINLVGNAVKFTEHGTVTVRARLDHEDEISWLTVEVEDTGPGIREEDMGRLFTHFEQTEHGRASGTGTGLGLAISREFCRLMGGTIEAQSVYGQGSTFRVHVPTAEDVDASGMPRVTEAPKFLPSEIPCRILVVDDVEDNRRVLCEMLRRAGAVLEEAENGLRALEVMDAFRPALVLLDMRMPVMDGYETTRRIRQKYGQKIKILAVTASAFEEDRQPMIEAGVDDCLRKPVRAREMIERIEGLCGVRTDRVEVGGEQPVSEGASWDSLRQLPPEVRLALHDAVLRADTEVIAEHVARVQTLDAAAAELLKVLADSYDYDRLLTLLE